MSSAERMRQEIRKLMRGGNEAPYAEQLDQELDAISGRLVTNQQAENADEIKAERKRALNPAGYLAVGNPEVAKQIIVTAENIAGGETPTDKRRLETWRAANDMLQSVFQHYTKAKPEKKTDER